MALCSHLFISTRQGLLQPGRQGLGRSDIGSGGLTDPTM